jgi:phospholipid/cholesterol/gamma-HCH transport system substrate-binding protein
MTVHNVPAKLAGVGLFVAFSMLLFVVLFKGAGGSLGLSDPYRVKVVMPDGFQLVDNADVRRAGVKIGRVAGITNRGAQAVVEVEIDDDHAPIYRDATTLLRTKTLVGENYIELNSGSPRAGRLPVGGVVPVEQAGEAVQLDEILSSLDPRTRDSIKRNLDGLGSGVAGRQRELNRLFAAARPTLGDGGTVMGIVRAQREGFARLVQDTGRVTQALGRRTQDLQTLARSAKSTAETVAARDAALARTFESLPGALRQARGSVGRLRDFSGTATPVVADLQRGFTGLRPVVAQLPQAAAATRATMEQLRPFLKVADPMFAKLAPFSRTLTPTIPALDAFLRQVQPVMGYLKPYDREVGQFFANNQAMIQYRDAHGAAIRIFNHVDQQSVNLSPEAQAAVQRLNDAGALVLGDFPRKRNNSYPKPGTVNTPEVFDGNYPRVQARP